MIICMFIVSDLSHTALFAGGGVLPWEALSPPWVDTPKLTRNLGADIGCFTVRAVTISSFFSNHQN